MNPPNESMMRDFYTVCAASGLVDIWIVVHDEGIYPQSRNTSLSGRADRPAIRDFEEQRQARSCVRNIDRFLARRG